jgi:hypothetical protein
MAALPDWRNECRRQGEIGLRITSRPTVLAPGSHVVISAIGVKSFRGSQSSRAWKTDDWDRCDLGSVAGACRYPSASHSGAPFTDEDDVGRRQDPGGSAPCHKLDLVLSEIGELSRPTHQPGDILKPGRAEVVEELPAEMVETQAAL